MCHARGLPQFAYNCIEQISDLATPELLIVDNSDPRHSNWKEKLHKAFRLDGILWYLQNRLFPLRDIAAYRANALKERFPGVPTLCCQITRKGKWSEYFSAEDIARIRDFKLDFILKFGYGIIRGDIFSAAQYGIWSYHHDDEERYRGGPPAFWEIYSDDSVTGAMLQRINETLDRGVVLKKIYVPTAKISYRANLQQVLESSTPMARWVCLDILHGHATYLEGPASQSKARIYRAPKDIQMLGFWWRLIRNWIGDKLANQRVDDWNVGLVRCGPEEFLRESFRPNIEWSAYQEKYQFVADPFLVSDSEGLRILCEEFDWFSESGRILEMRPASDDPLARGTPAIDEDAHMSYPYVLEHEGETYCIPECAERREIALYRWEREKKIWVRDTVLLHDIPAVDPTIIQADGAWWLFHSHDSGVGQWSLYIWRADDLRGPWHPHPGNPVKTDVRSSRPAGKPFWHEGRLYRPAQDNRKCYGCALAINRIETLSLKEFREVVVRRLEPSAAWPYPHGIHTLNGVAGLSVIDAKRHCWPPALILKRLWFKRLSRPRPRDFHYRSGRFQFEPRRM